MTLEPPDEQRADQPVAPTPDHFPEAADDVVERRRVTGRDVAVWGARTTGGLIAVGIAVVVAIGSIFIAVPTWSATPPSVLVTPQAAQELLVCPGAILRLADDTGQNASSATPIDTPDVKLVAASGSMTSSALQHSDAQTDGTDQAPQIAVVTPDGDVAPVVAGFQTDVIATAQGNVQGLATASCEAPTLRSWIVGGSTELGRTSILTLVNPTTVSATVDLSLYAGSGEIDAVGLKGIVVPPGSQRVVPINGFALEQSAPVIGITSTGGNVAAYLQQSIIRTLTPGGVDLVGGQAPATQLVIPGIGVADSTSLSALTDNPTDAADIPPTVRLLAPGTGTTTATVALVPKGSTVAAALAAPDSTNIPTGTDSDDVTPSAPAPRSFTVSLTGGVVDEIPIIGVAAGQYTVVVTADHPVVGAVRTAAGGTGSTDFAWSSPASPLGDHAVVVAPDATVPGTPAKPAAPGAKPTAPAMTALTSVVAIANPGTADASVTLSGGATPQTVTVPAGGTEELPLVPGMTYQLAGATGLSAAVRTSGFGYLAQSPLQPPPELAQPVRVGV